MLWRALPGPTLAAQGHTVRLMSPEYVQPYVKSQKTDDRDAEAIAEAATRPTMHLVTLKSESNSICRCCTGHASDSPRRGPGSPISSRAVLLERGVILPKRRAPLRHRLHELMAGELPISPRVIRLLEDLRDECAALTRENQQARQLATIPGIGMINATALLAAVGDGSAFAKGRDLAAWLGLTPRQHSTGGRTQLRISKRGNKYLRTQLIHGARAALTHFAKTPTRMAMDSQPLVAGLHP